MSRRVSAALAVVGQRNGDFEIYTIPISGGQETRLTTAKGLDDGPEYFPDGKYIYFNSERTGLMQIWRMRVDGSERQRTAANSSEQQRTAANSSEQQRTAANSSEQQQITSDDFNNWFPHISPDGKWMVFLTYEKDVTGHPENKNVRLRLMSLKDADKKISVLATLFGGQGTMNVPSWSPDSKQLAFVSYELIPGWLNNFV